jgi:hypothetical protein
VGPYDGCNSSPITVKPPLVQAWCQEDICTAIPVDSEHVALLTIDGDLRILHIADGNIEYQSTRFAVAPRLVSCGRLLFSSSRILKWPEFSEVNLPETDRFWPTAFGCNIYVTSAGMFQWNGHELVWSAKILGLRLGKSDGRYFFGRLRQEIAEAPPLVEYDFARKQLVRSIPGYRFEQDCCVSYVGENHIIVSHHTFPTISNEEKARLADHKWHAVHRREDLTKLWQCATIQSVPWKPGHSSAPSIASGRIFMHDRRLAESGKAAYSVLECRDLDSGKILWHEAFPNGTVPSGCCVAGDFVWIAQDYWDEWSHSLRTALLCWKLDGTSSYEYEMPPVKRGSYARGEDRFRLVGTCNGHLLVIHHSNLYCLRTAQR